MFRKRIIAWFFIFVICFSVLPAAHAEEYISKNTTYWEHLMHGLVKSTSGVDFVGPAVQCIAGKLEGDICEMSEDGYHYGDHVVWVGEGAYKDGQPLAKVICKYCNKQFNALASDYQQSYEAQVEELPAQSFNSDGSILWSPKFSYITASADSPTGSTTYSAACPHYSGTIRYSYNQSGYGQCTFNCDLHTLSVSVQSGFSEIRFSRSYVYFLDSYPIDGLYQRLASPFYEGYYTLTSLQRIDISKSFDAYSSGLYYDAGDSFYLCVSDSSPSINSNPTLFLYFQFYAPVFKVTPFSSSGLDVNTTYNINSRPTSITGDYGIIGDNGQIIKVEGDKIVNETNNTYYNPSTGETTTITDWSYNYEDRSYTVTTESGDTVTITYGDEHVTIKEGDTVYNVYYLVNGSGSENPDPGPGPDVCDHTWTETGRTDPTCTIAGKVTSTCSKCNQTKTETIPATGHSWVVDRTVQTTYDEEGNLLQQGYTIYSCSVCGEQYKDMEGTGPPGSEEEKSIWEKIGDFFGTIGGGFIDIIGAIAGKLLDALIALAEMLMDKLKTVVETVLSIFDEVPALFGGFLDFLAAIFPFLPPEITTILTFGVVAVVFIGILKAVRR